MIKAIIFDCFGVLVAPSLEPFINTYLAHDEEKRKQALALDKLASTGKISFDQQLREYSHLAGISMHETRQFMENNPRNVQLLSYIKTELEPVYKIGMLSNAGDDWLDELFLAEDIRLFDAVVLSYQVGYAKPAPQIYETMVSKLGVKFEESIFVDDLQRYVDGAKRLGMQAITYKDFASFQKELKALLSAN